MLTTPFQSHELALDATLPEAGSDDYSVKILEALVDIAIVEFFRRDIYGFVFG